MCAYLSPGSLLVFGIYRIYRCPRKWPPVQTVAFIGKWQGATCEHLLYIAGAVNNYILSSQIPFKVPWNFNSWSVPKLTFQVHFIFVINLQWHWTSEITILFWCLPLSSLKQWISFPLFLFLSLVKKSSLYFSLSFFSLHDIQLLVLKQSL